MATIVYTTNTGTSERYAKMLSEKTGFEAVSLADAEPSDNSEVIYIGWIMGGAIQGYAEAKQKFGSLKAVCAVGMMVDEKREDEVKTKNNITEPFFMLKGAFDISKLKGMYKMMMGMMMKMIKSKLKESNDPEGQKVLSFFENGIDLVSEENLDPVIEWLKEN